VHPFILLLASPFFRRGTEGVANQQLKPPQSPFEKGGSKRIAINGCTLISLLMKIFSTSIQRNTNIFI